MVYISGMISKLRGIVQHRQGVGRLSNHAFSGDELVLKGHTYVKPGYVGVESTIVSRPYLCQSSQLSPSTNTKLSNPRMLKKEKGCMKC